VVDEAIAALCAEAVGAMEALRDLTVDYLKQRQQFGRAIGEFQALQHRAADMLVATEQARSMAMYAAMMVAGAGRRGAAHRALAREGAGGSSPTSSGKEACSCMAGIAVTEEYKAGHYFKRLTMLAGMFGDTDHHLGRWWRRAACRM
jgi:alkylation response protein AidB-like acyl-CoA dehydrogenase